MGAKIWQYEVSHPEYGAAVVDSVGPDSATCAAAKAWGAEWREIAGYCRVTRLGTAQKPRCKRCHNEYGQPGDPSGLCPSCLEIIDRQRREAERYARTQRRDRRTAG